MAGLASVVLLICWLPGQFYFMLSQMGYLKVHVMPHRWLNVLALSSSCWNPIIYCFSNPQYREGFKNELSRFLCLCKLVRNGSYTSRSNSAQAGQHSSTPAFDRRPEEISSGPVGTLVWKLNSVEHERLVCTSEPYIQPIAKRLSIATLKLNRKPKL